MGGGICNSGALWLRDATVSRNTAAFGGGVFSGTISPVLSFGPLRPAPVVPSNANVQTRQNLGGNTVEDSASLVARNTDFIENTATLNGGGLQVRGGTARLDGGLIRENTAASGGGIHLVGSLLARSLTLADNTASLRGGGVYVAPTAEATLLDSLMVRNVAEGRGGAMLVGGTVDASDSLIVNNTAAAGGGAFVTEEGTVSDGMFLFNDPDDVTGPGA